MLLRELLEAKQKSSQTENGGTNVKVRITDEGIKSLAANKAVLQKYGAFLNAKKANPTAPVGSSDKKFIGILSDYRHAHLTHDISVVYTISGANPTILTIYGVWSHDQLGTGQPANVNRMKQTAKKFDRAEFKEVV